MLHTLLVGVALTLAAPAPKEAPKTAPKLDGTWEITDAEGPKEAKDELAKNSVRFVFAEKTLTVMMSRPDGKDRNEEATYEADFTKKPVTIDIMPTKGPKGEIVRGIIEIDGDKLKLCFGRDRAERPTEFKGNAEKNVQLFVLKRTIEKK